MRSVLALSTEAKSLISRTGGGISDDLTQTYFDIIVPHREVTAYSVRGSLYSRRSGAENKIIN